MEKARNDRFTQFFYVDDAERIRINFDKIFFKFHTAQCSASDREIFFLVLLLTRFVCEELIRRVKNVHATLGDLPMKQW